MKRPLGRPHSVHALFWVYRSNGRYRDLNSSIQVFVWAVWYRGQKKLYEVLRLFYFGGGSQIPPTLTLMWRWTKTTMRSNMSPVLERSGECPACRSASIYSRAISPPAFR